MEGEPTRIHGGSVAHHEDASRPVVVLARIPVCRQVSPPSVDPVAHCGIGAEYEGRTQSGGPPVLPDAIRVVDCREVNSQVRADRVPGAGDSAEAQQRRERVRDPGRGRQRGAHLLHLRCAGVPLRDTFGSQLVSGGIPLLYVSRQLGHSTTAVTEKHYAKWIPGDDDLYVEPIRLEAGEVPADLLARLRSESPPISPHGEPFVVPHFSRSATSH